MQFIYQLGHIIKKTRSLRSLFVKYQAMFFPFALHRTFPLAAFVASVIPDFMNLQNRQFSHSIKQTKQYSIQYPLSKGKHGTIGIYVHLSLITGSIYKFTLVILLVFNKKLNQKFLFLTILAIWTLSFLIDPGSPNNNVPHSKFAGTE